MTHVKKKWRSPFEEGDLRLHPTFGDPINFGKPDTITIHKLKTVLSETLEFQRFLNTDKAKRNFNKGNGFRADMARPIFITEIIGTDNTLCIDGAHTANAMAHLYEDDVEVPCMMYQHSTVDAAMAFALWNKEGIRPLNNEEVFPAQVTYGSEQALLTFDVLNSSKRTFDKMPKGHPRIKMIANNKRKIRRSYLERAIKLDVDVTKGVLDLLVKGWPTPKDGITDSAILAYALTYGECKTPVLKTYDDSGEPGQTFEDWFINFVNGKKQSELLFQDKRMHNKEADSIFAQILCAFLSDTHDEHQNKDWYGEVLDTWYNEFEPYYLGDTPMFEKVAA